ncbi:MAG: PHP domain-containing protein, partial [Candidatus Zipacnadales bacterium]
VFTEHAGQLYLPAHAYWEGMFRRKASVIPAARSANQDRIRRYREEMRAYRSDKVGVGLEVELDAEGRLTLLAEDYEGWDVLIGAVHALRHCDGEGATEAQVASAFMRETEELTALGIDILAHPFRFFRRAGRPVPRRLYRRVAELLATYGVAAEVNYHTNEPDPDFFALCLEHNVKLSLGTDSHALHEVGELGPHLDLLRKIVSPDQLPDVLFTPTLGG